MRSALPLNCGESVCLGACSLLHEPTGQREVTGWCCTVQFGVRRRSYCVWFWMSGASLGSVPAAARGMHRGFGFWSSGNAGSS